MPITKVAWDGMSDEDKAVLKSGASKAITLMSCPAVWHKPALRMGLRMTPGLKVRQDEKVTDATIRAFYHAMFDVSSRGAEQTSSEGWAEYLANPVRVFLKTGQYGFVFPASTAKASASGICFRI